MKENKDFNLEVEDLDIDFGKYFRRLLAKWKLILIWAFVAALIGVVYALSVPRTYTSTAVLAPEITTRTTSGGLSSLASLAGISVGSMAVTDAMHPDLYPTIVKSSDFMAGLFDTPVEFSHRDTLVQTNLYGYMSGYWKSPWWAKVMAVPSKAMGWLTDLFRSSDETVELDDFSGALLQDTLSLTKTQAQVVSLLRNNIEMGYDKKNYILSLSVTMQDSRLAAVVANEVIDHLSDFVKSYRNDKAQQNVDYYQKLYDESKEDYHEAQRRYTQYADSHMGMNLKSTLTEMQRLQNEQDLQFQMFNQTAQNLLTAKAKLQLESPVLVKVQSPKAPIKGKPSRKSAVMIFFILGGLLGGFKALLDDSETEEEE